METDNNLVSELTSEPILIGEWTFYPDILQLKRDDGSIKLEPRVAYLLLHLARNVGKPLSRDDLMETVWPNLVVGDEALTSAINKLRKAFADDSHHPEVIETIPKVGYRLIASVEFIPAENTADTPGRTANLAQSKYSGHHRVYIAVSAAFIIILILMTSAPWFSTEQEEGESTFLLDETLLSDKPSIAVLAFENLSAEADQEYFSRGIAEDIITDLSQLSNLAVIARTSSFTNDLASMKVQDIGNNLGVKYLLLGSVRKAGNQIRITVQLVDSESGQQLWAERFDRELNDIFAVQDEIAEKIISSLSIQLRGDEQQQLAHNQTDSFEAYDLFLQGQELRSSYSREGTAAAAEIFRRAIGLDPDFARAYGALAMMLTRQVASGYSNTPTENNGRALNLARKAASINPESPQVQWALGYVYMYQKQFDKALEALQRAVSLSPSYADGYALLALINNNMGRGEEAVRLIEKGMELNPYYSWDYLYNLGRAHYALGNYEQAAEYLQQALERNEAPSHPRIFLVASYVRLDLQEDAEWEVEQLDMFHPEATILNLARSIPISNTELRARLLGDIESAGLAE